jgi:hypothetical protein
VLLLVYLMRGSSIAVNSCSRNALVTSARLHSTNKARYRSKSALRMLRGRGLSMLMLSRSQPGRAVKMITRSARYTVSSRPTPCSMNPKATLSRADS